VITPILELPAGVQPTAIQADPWQNTVLIGLNDGRILRSPGLSSNAYLTGHRSIYAEVQDGFGLMSEQAWTNILYQIHNRIMKVNSDQEVVLKHTVPMPSGAQQRDTVIAIFTTPILWAGNDFGWWEEVRWQTIVPTGTTITVAARAGATDAAVVGTPWVWWDSVRGENRQSLEPFGGSRLQIQARLATTVASVGPSLVNLSATYRTKRSAYFFSKKFSVDRESNLQWGLVTAQVATPRHSTVQFGLVGSNSATWSDYQMVDLHRIVGLPPAAAARFKVGIKLMHYHPAAIPSVDGFALMVGGQVANKINQT